MTEKGATSPISERSNLSQMAQSRVIATDHSDHADRSDTAGSVDPAGRGASAGAGSGGLAGTITQSNVAAPPAGLRDQVTVRMPADGAYLSVLRTATAGLAARLDFTLDEIEDMRIAVDEACAMLLSQAIPGSDLECAFSLGQDEMTVSVSVRCLAPRVPAGDTFAWTVLSALAGSVDAQVGPGDVLAIVLRKSRDSSRSV
jgi:serine/threonine-protein kinase RsbW